jgi:hypothetical protein
MSSVALSGFYKHHKNENYNDYLKALKVGWFKRHTANTAQESLQVQEGTNGTLNFKLSEGIKTTEKTISLGEEHSETLPNGESTRGITVREGDSNLITRCESKTLGKMEIIREFSKEGMILYIKLLDRDFEAKRFYKRS